MKKEPQIFEEQKQETKKLKPLVLTEEVAQDSAPIIENRNDTLSPAVRKIVAEKNIDIGEIVYDHYIRNSNNPSAESLNYKFIIFLAEGLYVNDFIKKSNSGTIRKN